MWCERVFGACTKIHKKDKLIQSCLITVVFSQITLKAATYFSNHWELYWEKNNSKTLKYHRGEKKGSLLINMFCFVKNSEFK